MIKPIDLALREDFGCMFGSKYTNINDHNSCYLTVVNKSLFVTFLLLLPPVKIFCDQSVITNHARDHGRDHSFHFDHAFSNA